MERLTEAFCQRLQSQIDAGEVVAGSKVYDSVESGFFALIGRRTILWRAKYTQGGKEHRVCLGQWPVVSAAEARAAAREARHERMRRRIDAQIAGDMAAKDTRSLYDFAVIVAEKRTANASRSVCVAVSRWCRRIEADLKGPTSELTRQMLMDFVNATPASERQRVFTFLSAALSLAVREGAIKAAPITSDDAPTAYRCGHIASPTTYPAYCKALEGIRPRISDALLPCFCLSQLLPVRISELFELTWGDVDFANHRLRVFQKKTNKTNMLPMDSLVYSIFKSMNKTKQKIKDGDKVFDFSIRRIQRIYEGVSGLSAHSVRSCFYSILRDMDESHGIDIHGLESCLGHCGDAYDGAYNRSQEMAQKDRCLTTWHLLLCRDAAINGMLRAAITIEGPDYPTEYLDDCSGTESQPLSISRQIQHMKENVSSLIDSNKP